MSTDPQGKLHEVVRRMAASLSVAAIAMVGSTATGLAGPDSDIDVFIYADGDLSDVRARIAAELANPDQWRSVGERSFGEGDVWRLSNGGLWLDLMYWSPDWAEDQLRRVLVEHRPSMGYSTAFWRSIRDAQPLYERDDWHPDLQRQAHLPYPEDLRTAIMAANYPYLRDHIFSFRN
jgi:predicted nucleotidyltransferase